jgi:hypothetical protein
MLQRLIDLHLRLPPLLLPQNLHLPIRIQPINLIIINRQKHLLQTPQIRNPIRVKTPRHEASTRILACKDMVAAAWAVVFAACCNVVDGAVYCEEDGLGRVGAVVGF